MKPAPAILIPSRVQTDLLEARRVLGGEPGLPVGLVVSAHGFEELRGYGCAFPCKVAVLPTAPRDTAEWFYLPANFQPFANLIKS